MINKLAILLVMVTVIVTGCMNGDNKTSSTSDSQKETQSEIKQVIDANKFFRISESELVKILGEPESKDNWSFNSSNGKKYKATTFEYDGGNQEFLVIDNKVVRFTYYANDQKYTSDEDLFKQLGVKPSAEMKKSSGGTTMKFNSVAEKVPEIWITVVENKIDDIKITYDLRYF